MTTHNNLTRKQRLQLLLVRVMTVWLPLDPRYVVDVDRIRAAFRGEPDPGGMSPSLFFNEGMLTSWERSYSKDPHPVPGP